MLVERVSPAAAGLPLLVAGLDLEPGSLGVLLLVARPDVGPQAVIMSSATISIRISHALQAPSLAQHRPGSKGAAVPVVAGNTGLWRRLYAMTHSGRRLEVSGAVEVGV